MKGMSLRDRGIIADASHVLIRGAAEANITNLPIVLTRHSFSPVMMPLSAVVTYELRRVRSSNIRLAGNIPHGNHVVAISILPGKGA
jgi:hypothetical protein